MVARAREGTCLAALIALARPLCQAAERQCPRSGPGCPPSYPDWLMAVLIIVGVLARRKTKSAQYRYLTQHRTALRAALGLRRWPARATFFERYRRAHRVLAVAIKLQGRRAISEALADAAAAAVDKSLLPARGPEWPQRARQAGRTIRGTDREATWGYSEHHGWVYGYSYEVIVTATPGSLVFPLLASVGTASRSEGTSFGAQIEHLPNQTRHVLADRGYDKNEYGDRLEYDAQGRATGRHFLCPPVRRHRPARRRGPPCRQNHQVRLARRRRQRRIAFYRRAASRRLYARRTRTVEPFNEWFKNLFDLHERAWHRGLDNNHTQLLAAIFAYQLLVRFNHRCHRRNGQVQWLLDGL